MTWDIFPTVTDSNLLPGRTNVSGLRNFKFSITNWLKVMVLLSPWNGQCGIEPGLQVSCHLLHFRFSGEEAFDVWAVFLAAFEKNHMLSGFGLCTAFEDWPLRHFFSCNHRLHRRHLSHEMWQRSAIVP